VHPRICYEINRMEGSMADLSMRDLEELLAHLVNGEFEAFHDRMRLLDDAGERQVELFLAAADGKDVDLLDRYTNWRNSDRFGAAYRLLPALGLSGAMTARRAEALLRLLDIADDGEQHFIGEAMTRAVRAMPALAVEVGGSLRANGPTSAVVLRGWAVTYASAAPKLASQHALKLADQEGHEAALPLLMVLAWRQDTVRTILSPHRELTLEILGNATARGIDPAWDAISEQAQFDIAAQRFMLEALDRGVPQSAAAIALSIARSDDKTYGVDALPLEQVLERLASAAMVDASIRGSVDMALTHCLHREALAALTQGTLSKLAISGAVSSFTRAFESLARKEKRFAGVLTAWLLSPTASFEAIRELLRLVATGHAHPALDETALNAASNEHCVKAMRRLLACLHDGPSLCRFAAIVARMPSLGEAGLRLASEMFNILFLEFPGATEEFLEPLAKPALKRQRGYKIFRGVHANAVRWRKLLECLPQRAELRISDTDLFAYRSVRLKMGRFITRQAEAQSVFAGMVTKRSMAQGRRFASRIGDFSPTITDLNSVGHSMELPSSELADPMRGLMTRMSYLENSR
jgi:hypothetical protein